ncbi:MAG: plasmid pRiA4b ORF-3 family protein [Bacteroidaceae bacterium]|nr:plasmid pRiA4b ORF-3 family protein [Bacteroidaceae bacterium]
MAKRVRFNPSSKKEQKKEDATFAEVLASLPKEIRKEMERQGIQSFEDFIGFMLMNGIDPLKMKDFSEKNESLPDDFDPKDVMLDDYFDDEDDEDFDEDDRDFNDEDDEDFDDEDEDFDEGYMLGQKLPERKFIGKPKREFHIRIKLNNAPVKIWRELVVPSNITLELLAYVLINAMGWQHEHLYQFVAKNNVYYVNSFQMKERANSFKPFFSRVVERNSEKTTLEMVLQPKGERMKFEYDFGDSWTHDLWVKAARDYAPGEQPAIRLLKGQGACPPEDCGGVWGYAELLEMNKKAHKTADEKDRLKWYDIPKDYDPDDCDLEWLQEEVDALWERIKSEE